MQSRQIFCGIWLFRSMFCCLIIQTKTLASYTETYTPTLTPIPSNSLWSFISMYSMCSVIVLHTWHWHMHFDFCRVSLAFLCKLLFWRVSHSNIIFYGPSFAIFYFELFVIKKNKKTSLTPLKIASAKSKWPNNCEATIDTNNSASAYFFAVL